MKKQYLTPNVETHLVVMERSFLASDFANTFSGQNLDDEEDVSGLIW